MNLTAQNTELCGRASTETNGNLMGKEFVDALPLVTFLEVVHSTQLVSFSSKRQQAIISGFFFLNLFFVLLLFYLPRAFTVRGNTKLVFELANIFICLHASYVVSQSLAQRAWTN